MTTTPDRKDLGSRLERLERAVRNLQRRSTLSSASISGGDLTVRGGGNIRVIEGGNLIGEGDGNLDWEGDAHFGGDLEITGNTSITGTLELQEGIIGPGALSLRTEAKTFGGSTITNANQADLNVSVSVPDWAVTTSVVATGSAGAEAPDGTRVTAVVTIAGDAGPTTSGVAYAGATTIPSLHRRDFSPTAGSNFTVNLHAGASPISQSAAWGLNLVIMAVFNN